MTEFDIQSLLDDNERLETLNEYLKDQLDEQGRKHDLHIAMEIAKVTSRITGLEHEIARLRHELQRSRWLIKYLRHRHGDRTFPEGYL